MSKTNGGFPPIKYCDEKIKNNENSKTIQRERAYAPTINNNINIRQILKKNNKPIISTESIKPIKIDIVEDF